MIDLREKFRDKIETKFECQETDYIFKMLLHFGKTIKCVLNLLGYRELLRALFCTFEYHRKRSFA